MPDTQLRSARNQNRSGEPAASARIQALPRGRCTQARPRHPPLPSPDTSQELRGWRDAEGPGAPARGQQGSSTLQWWGCRGRCLEMTSGGAAPPGASAKRHAEEGPGTASSLPRKRSQEASLLEGGRMPLPSSKAAPAQWSWKRNACAIVLRGTPRRCSAWPGRHVPSSTPAVGATQVTLAGIWFPVACPLPGLAEKDSRPMLEPH